MALRDQPYIPLYIQDIMTDEKLNECSASTHGIYIKGIMCLMHKSEEYGTILLKQKDKQRDKQVLNFAYKLVKHLPYTVEEIEKALAELISEDVLQLEGDLLSQRRMVKDNALSLVRAKAGKKGGDKNNFAIANTKAKHTAKSENEYEDVNESIDENKDEHLLRKFIKENCPRISKIKTQLTDDNCDALIDKFGKEILMSVLPNLENFQDIKKYNSVNLTLHNWCKREQNDRPKEKLSPAERWKTKSPASS